MLQMYVVKIKISDNKRLNSKKIPALLGPGLSSDIEKLVHKLSAYSITIVANDDEIQSVR